MPNKITQAIKSFALNLVGVLREPAVVGVCGLIFVAVAFVALIAVALLRTSGSELAPLIGATSAVMTALVAAFAGLTEAADRSLSILRTLVIGLLIALGLAVVGGTVVASIAVANGGSVEVPLIAFESAASAT